MKLKKTLIFIINKIYYFITSKMDFTHYYVLSRNIPVYKFTDKLGLLGNVCYGNNIAVKNAMGKDFNSDCMIEHGIYFGRYVLEEECLYPEISTIYTYSPYRKEVLNEYFGPNLSKKIVVVGPYIKFSDHLYSKKKLSKLKKKLGKVLIVFPTHSSMDTSVDFSHNSWLNEIERRAKGFDTVIISLFWADINKGLHKQYMGKGYLIACNGNRFDPNFLSREKDLISLADMTMSNNIGTHIGYCICMDKPHYIFHQEVHNSVISDRSKNSTDIIEMNRQKEYTELYTHFSEFSTTITPKQKEIVEYYWGPF